MDSGREASGHAARPPQLLERLVSPFGVVGAVDVRVKESAAQHAHRAVCRIGSGFPGKGQGRKNHTMCGGSSLSEADTARLVAVAEGAERYAGILPVDDETVLATADELAGECLDPARYPRCSAAEYDHPRCSVGPFDRTAKIRWVRGYDLVGRRTLWVPAVMASYATIPESPAEQFNFQVSTGYAVHTDAVEAAVRGICEVIERDIIAVLWLQRLPLPRLGADVDSEVVSEVTEWLERRFTRIHLFDATSDLGVPTVYAVAAADEDQRASRYVACGTGRNLAEAAEKALLEVAGGDEYIHETPPLTDMEEIGGAIGETARYMAVQKRANAFDFLTGTRAIHPREERPELPQDPDKALAVLTERLATAGMQVAVLDRTTQELRDVGLTAVNVVVPDLQPMSTDPWAQFKAHSRLYDAPRLMGYRVLPEKELNPWPQPFA